MIARSRVGDWVIAIGNPFGLGGSLSAGVISAMNRDINAGPYDSFIQTDAAINRGNSGGPLFNMQGEVIGVNTAIISPTGGSVGIGFAIPADMALPVIEQLRAYGETRRGWLGVRIQTVTEELAESLGMSKPRGALISEVTSGGPAEEAGLKQGDVILRFDRKEVAEMRDLPRIVAETEVNKKVQVEVLRRGKVIKKTVTVGRLDESQDQRAEAKPKKKDPKPAEKPSILGMQLAPLTEQARAAVGLKASDNGVLIDGVETNSAAALAGLRRGFVIAELDQNGPQSRKMWWILLKKLKVTAKICVGFAQNSEWPTFCCFAGDARLAEVSCPAFQQSLAGDSPANIKAPSNRHNEWRF